MANELIVRPVDRRTAKRLCEAHPHARTLPNSSKYYMAAYIGGRIAGLAVWGYGIRPRHTPIHLFGEAGHIADYLELTRYFVYDWVPQFTASKFLANTHRIIKKHAPWVKWLYTHAAGFQGLIGTIYQACNYHYIGRHKCDAFVWMPSINGLVHDIAIWHRYGSGERGLDLMRRLDPESKRWAGYNFRYLLFLCHKGEQRKLMEHATFEIQPYPSKDDLRIWIYDEYGEEEITPEFAKSVPIIKLPTKRAAVV